MKLKHLALTLILAVTSAFGQGDVVSGVKAVNRYFNERPTQKHAILSTGECAAGIAFSANPAGAAIVGLPVLALGNGLGYLLRNAQATPYERNVDVVTFVHNTGRYIKNHPTLIQDASGEFCLAYGLTRHGRTKPAAKRTPQPKPQPQPQPNPTPEPTPTPDPTPTPNPTPTPTPDPTPTPTPTPAPGKGCIQDCGFPGNGGVNGGSDTKKPPFPGKGTTKHSQVVYQNDGGVVYAEGA